MMAVREWLIRLWGSIRGHRRDVELEEELRIHLELAPRTNDGDRIPLKVQPEQWPCSREASPGRWRRCATSEGSPGSTI
jgi:hypothetical protein